MKKTLLQAWAMLTLLLTGVSAAAQAPNWQAVTAIENSNSDYSAVQAMVADDNGNLYLTGDFRGTITLGTISLTNTGFRLGSFVAKWSSASSSFVWAQRVGTSSTVQALARSGANLYVAAGGTITKLTDAGSSGTIN